MIIDFNQGAVSQFERGPGWVWNWSGPEGIVIVPDTEGLEFTSPEHRQHFRAPKHRLHFTAPTSPGGYRASEEDN